MNTPAIEAAMRERYKAPEYALMFEVGNATGFSTRRHADAVAMSLWPSRGLDILGFEFKASRSDWLRELKNPVKAEEIACYCDHWFVVTLPDVIKAGECPSGWGHMVLQANGFRMVQPGPKNENLKPLTRSFIGAMLRRASEADERVLRELVDKETAVIRRQATADAKAAHGRAATELEEMKARVEAFEKAAGFSIGSRWGDDAKTIGAAVKLVQKVGPRRRSRR